MRSLSYIFYNFFYKHLLKLYLKTDSTARFDGFKLRILKGVFHPKLFFSTSYFYSFLSSKEFQNRKFLEIGSGSGILSMLAHRNGALVTAIDIDPKAVKNTSLNFESNFKPTEQITIIQSDLFSNVPVQQFDMVAINPPYYFKKIEVDAHYAWYCGEQGEYFTRLFSGLKNYTSRVTEVYMVLEENCDIERIKNLAAGHNLGMEKVDEKLIKWERNFIFQLK